MAAQFCATAGAVAKIKMQAVARQIVRMLLPGLSGGPPSFDYSIASSAVITAKSCWPICEPGLRTTSKRAASLACGEVIYGSPFFFSAAGHSQSAGNAIYFPRPSAQDFEPDVSLGGFTGRQAALNRYLNVTCKHHAIESTLKKPNRE